MPEYSHLINFTLIMNSGYKFLAKIYLLTHENAMIGHYEKWQHSLD